ncbi:MAG: succinyl-diaminopimelate desuccinylase [Acetobacter sp.]|jgi:succinyl-diaminopimelate desuccinylase|nr:succinyl-diaminopimelate desuccinylase [Acetobacter sp.]MCH4062237.1 succinyl-diaminopimelate desuccinylase [Acetobacter sp.]MCH4088916.1 succinyl-diaminopimelate desuccinylase [Acetobacter sp.]MCI1292819.1 succinyl-diaminopimelate desuccinylase [Acetobacter sp.]MCI1319080.1 succinyl-diaminopimelate desuccinylase [Acetobacter sp.]
MAETIDGALLAARLIQAPSVTPDPGGAQELLIDLLETHGFKITRLPFGEGADLTPNFFARWGSGSPHLCFAGHTDVVPPGAAADWTHDPFSGSVVDGIIYGRGACDMKGGIAAFVAGALSFLKKNPGFGGSISLLITGDEEGHALFGTARVLEWMAAHNQIPDFCVVGEPTCPQTMGEVIKIGRRGSLNARIKVRGRQGHVAYPHRADNPVHRLIRLLHELTAEPLDTGTRWFEPSGLQVTSVDVGNPASNVIPAEASAALNIRFNDLHSGASLEGWIRTISSRHAPDAEIEVSVSGESFLTQPGPAVMALADAVREVSGVEPKLDTGGGTSDARFIALYCPVAEFGLVGTSMHQVDEHVRVEDVYMLTRIYERMLERMAA